MRILEARPGARLTYRTMGKMAVSIPHCSTGKRESPPRQAQSLPQTAGAGWRPVTPVLPRRAKMAEAGWQRRPRPAAETPLLMAGRPPQRAQAQAGEAVCRRGRRRWTPRPTPPRRAQSLPETAGVGWRPVLLRRAKMAEAGWQRRTRPAAKTPLLMAGRPPQRAQARAGEAVCRRGRRAQARAGEVVCRRGYYIWSSGAGGAFSYAFDDAIFLPSQPNGAARPGPSQRRR